MVRAAWMTSVVLAIGCGGKIIADAGTDAPYDGPYSCVAQQSAALQTCTTTGDQNIADDLCGQLDASIALGPCPSGFAACCFTQFAECYYPPTYLDAEASLCGLVDGSFVRY